MGVYIKNMKIPKNCDDCNFSLDCLHDQHQTRYKMIGDRPNNCPMIELPKHGRLIDADALITKRHYDDHDACVIDWDDIEDAPTIVESEE